MVQNVVSEWKYYTIALLQDWEVKAIIAFCVTCVSSWTGVSYVLAQIFLGTMLIDLILGVFVAVRFHHFRCYKVKKGVSKIALWVFYVILMSFGDVVFQEVFGLDEKTHYLATMLTASIIFTEISSIIKHCQRLRFPIPDALITMNNGAKGVIMQKIKVFFKVNSGECKEGKYEKRGDNDKF